MNTQNKKRPVVALFFFFCALLNAQPAADSDDALDSLIDSLNIKNEELGIDKTEEVILDSIRIEIAGATRKEWVKANLFFSRGDRFTDAGWKAMARRQKDFFLSTKLFYDARVYIQPTETEGHFVGVVELTDGFLFGFWFWPWDLSAAFRHLMGGNEELGTTLGLNTQGLSWSHPRVADSPFGYGIEGAHEELVKEPGWLEESFRLNGRLFFSLGPVLNAGIEGGFTAWWLPDSFWLEPQLSASDIAANRLSLGLTGPGYAAQAGVYAELWPFYRFMAPFGCHARAAAGAVFPSEGYTVSYYADLDALVCLKPVEQLVFEIRVLASLRGDTLPATTWADSGDFRSPRSLEPNRAYARGIVQVTGVHVVSIPLGFTSLTFSPFAFWETAETFGSIEQFRPENLSHAFGAALAIGFTAPINLYFSFGVKVSVEASPAAAFLFSVDTDLY
ncbi:MAG: hypothetical protein JXD23_10580 [Spirochaetales bacterium]|nr:hypothetical protein [Spirochaetales bacterium]